MNKDRTREQNSEDSDDAHNQLKWHCVHHEHINECMDECKVKFFLNLFGKKYAMPIIRQLLLHKKMRFNEIEENLKGSPKTITSRLRDLEKCGVIIREVFNEIPMRVEYSLTERGKSLDHVFEGFAQWALGHDQV